MAKLYNVYDIKSGQLWFVSAKNEQEAVKLVVDTYKDADGDEYDLVANKVNGKVCAVKSGDDGIYFY